MKHTKIVQCIDIGNTRTSIGIYEYGTIKKHTYIPTEDLIKKKEFVLPPLLKRNVPVSYCSVVPNAEIELIKFFQLENALEDPILSQIIQNLYQTIGFQSEKEFENYLQSQNLFRVYRALKTGTHHFQIGKYGLVPNLLYLGCIGMTYFSN